MLVPLIENREYDTEGANFFIKKYLKNLLDKSDIIDTVLLACTHYPILKEKFEEFLSKEVIVISQGSIVAKSLADYMVCHPEIEEKCSKIGKIVFYTTDSTEDFDKQASIFYGKALQSHHIDL